MDLPRADLTKLFNERIQALETVSLTNAFLVDFLLGQNNFVPATYLNRILGEQLTGLSEYYTAQAMLYAHDLVAFADYLGLAVATNPELTIRPEYSFEAPVTVIPLPEGMKSAALGEPEFKILVPDLQLAQEFIDSYIKKSA